MTTASDHRRDVRYGAIAGLGAAGAIAAVVILALSVGFPEPGDPPEVTVTYLREHRDLYLSMGLLDIVALSLLVPFAGALRASLGLRGPLGATMLATGTSYAAFILVADGALAAAARRAEGPDPEPTVAVLRELGLLLAHVVARPALSLFLVTAAVGIVRTRRLPTYLAVAALALAVSNVVLLAGVFVERGPFAPGSLASETVVGAFFAWVGTASVILLRTPPRIAPYAQA